MDVSTGDICVKLAPLVRVDMRVNVADMYGVRKLFFGNLKLRKGGPFIVILDVLQYPEYAGLRPARRSGKNVRFRKPEIFTEARSRNART